MAVYAKVRTRAVRILLVAALVTSVLIAGMAISLNVVRHRDAQHFLNAVRTVKVGTTTGSEALKIAQRFNAEVYIVKHTELPSGFSDQIVDIPNNDCISGNCSLSFGADTHARWLRAVSYPWWNWPVLRKWIPITGIYADVTVEHGTVTDLLVSVESIQQQEVHTARTRITSKPLASAWNVRRYTAFNTGGPGRTTPTVEITFSPRSRHPKQEAALDFNLSCLRIGRSCSRCEILPGSCEDDEHGDWFYFEMPDDLVKNFQTAVNQLRLGNPEKIVISRIGWGGLTSQPLFDDKLPYRFPDGTMLGESDPERLIYFVKKWREQDRPNPQDQTVTFVFDKQDRLTGIMSHADGIRSRP